VIFLLGGASFQFNKGKLLIKTIIGVLTKFFTCVVLSRLRCFFVIKNPLVSYDLLGKTEIASNTDVKTHVPKIACTLKILTSENFLLIPGFLKCLLMKKSKNRC